MTSAVYQPTCQEIVGIVLAISGALMWLAGMLLIVKFAGKGTFS